MNSEALVIFHGLGTHFLSGVLKPGFKHCLCAVRHEHYWAVIDGADGLPAVYVSGEDNLAAWYRDMGWTVVEVERREPIRSPLALVSCVGLVKAIVGIRSRAVTPWGLYCHLTRKESSDVRKRAQTAVETAGTAD